MPKMPMPGRSRQVTTKVHATPNAAPRPQTEKPRSLGTTPEVDNARVLQLRMDRVLRQEQAEEMSGLAYSSMRELEDKGLFPVRVKLPGNRVGWRALEIQDWIAALPRAGAAA